MMKILARICLLGWLSAMSLSCASVDASRASASLARQILVTFTDEREGQVPVTSPANGYRPRGDYGNSTWSLRVAGQLAEDYSLRPVEQWPISALGVHCVVYEIPEGQTLEDALRRLAGDRRIEAVQAMKTFRVMAETYNDPYFKLQTGLRAMRIEDAHRFATGRDVSIAVIDTGVDARHPDLAGHIAVQRNFVERSPGTDDIHGTAVAGVIAATANNRQGIVGVAPGARLMALKACWPVEPLKPEAVCDSLTLSLALDGAIKLKPEIINLSLAGPDDPLVGRLVDKALAAGIVVVASASSPVVKDGGFPASVKGVVAVHTAPLDGKPLVPAAIAAPGQEILTTLPGGAYTLLSGSSFAAAHVSGLIALLLELKPHLAPAQIVSILHASATHAANAQASYTVDACAAVGHLLGQPACHAPAADSLLALPVER